MFKKKEDVDSDDEFTKNNTLEEIFKFRQSLKDIGVNPNPQVTIEDTIKQAGENERKEINFGNTTISSNTKELDASEVNDALKDKRKEIIDALFGGKKEDDETVSDNEETKVEEIEEVYESTDEDEKNDTEKKDGFDIKYEPMKFDAEKVESMINKAKAHLQSFGESVIESVVNTFDKTQEINTDEINSKVQEEMQKTQIIDSVNTVKEELSQETIVITAEERKEAEEKAAEELNKTIVLDENINEVLKNNADIDVNENAETTIVQEKETIIVPNLNDDSNVELNVESGDTAVITENLIKAKMGLESNTEIINTDEIRKKISAEYESSPEFEEMYKKTFGVDTMNVRREKERLEAEKEKINVTNELDYANMNVFEDKENEFEPVNYKFVGIAFNTYIIIEIKDEMYMIDQHAAHERILYEIVKQNYYSDDNKDEQMLLMPDIITLTHKELDIAKENVDMFARAGFSFEEFGENTIKLVSVPGMCEDLNTKQLFLDLLDEIDTVAVTARQEKEDKFIATVACKAAVKAKMKLDVREVDALMRELLSLPNPFSCPHGRPTANKMTKIDMEKKFSRR